jgi:hypothetical protein
MNTHTGLINAEAQRDFNGLSAMEDGNSFDSTVYRMAVHVCDGYPLFYMEGLKEVEINRLMAITELDQDDQDAADLDVIEEMGAFLFAKPVSLDTEEDRELAIIHAKKIANTQFRIRTKAEEIIKTHYEAITEYNRTYHDHQGHAA